MFIPSKREQQLGALEERVRRIHAVTPRLLLDVIAGVCVRSAVRNGPAKARIDRLIEAGAFTEATLALIELELPQWQLRHLIETRNSCFMRLTANEAGVYSVSFLEPRPPLWLDCSSANTLLPKVLGRS